MRFLPSCSFVLLDALKYPDKYNMFYIYCVLIELIASIIFPGSCLVISTRNLESCWAVNRIMQVESLIPKNLSFYQRWKCFKRPSLKEKPIKRFCKTKSLVYSITGLDTIGIVCNLIVFWYSILVVLLLVVGIIFNLDATSMFFEEMLPSVSRSKLVSTAILLFRVFIVACACVEAGSTLRIICILNIASIFALKQCVFRLSSRSPNFLMWKTLKIAYLMTNKVLSLIFSLYLTLVFLVEILCMTSSVLALGKMTWYLYIIFPGMGVAAVLVVSVVFHETINGYSESAVLRRNWRFWCAKDKQNGGSSSQFKLAYKYLLSVHPLAFSYLTIGRITKTTRTAFYNSILSYSISCILASKNSIDPVRY